MFQREHQSWKEFVSVKMQCRSSGRKSRFCSSFWLEAVAELKRKEDPQWAVDGWDV